jgi:hypothetical protein
MLACQGHSRDNNTDVFFNIGSSDCSAFSSVSLTETLSSFLSICPNKGTKSFLADWLIYYIQVSFSVKAFAQPIFRIFGIVFFTTFGESAWPAGRENWLPPGRFLGAWPA